MQEDCDVEGQSRLCIADEHYLPTMLAVYDMTQSVDRLGHLTYTNWAAGGWHPETFYPGDATTHIARMRTVSEESMCAPLPPHLSSFLAVRVATAACRGRPRVPPAGEQAGPQLWFIDWRPLRPLRWPGRAVLGGGGFLPLTLSLLPSRAHLASRCRIGRAPMHARKCMLPMRASWKACGRHLSVQVPVGIAGGDANCGVALQLQDDL